MARANNGGWDFVKVGNTYQYKEEGVIMQVRVLEDLSDAEYYNFRLRVLRATSKFPVAKEGEPADFTVTFLKSNTGYWNDMPQFYEHEEYRCEYPVIYPDPQEETK